MIWLRHAQQCGGNKLVNKIPNTSPFDNLISNDNTYVNKQ